MVGGACFGLTNVYRLVTSLIKVVWYTSLEGWLETGVVIAVAMGGGIAIPACPGMTGGCPGKPG